MYLYKIFHIRLWILYTNKSIFFGLTYRDEFSVVVLVDFGALGQLPVPEQLDWHIQWRAADFTAHIYHQDIILRLHHGSTGASPRARTAGLV